MKIVTGGKALLLPGDAESGAEKIMGEHPGMLPADILVGRASRKHDILLRGVFAGGAPRIYGYIRRGG